MTPHEAAVAEAMRQLRVEVRRAMAGRTLLQAAALAECSPNTLSRILRGEDVRFGTVAAVLARLGRPLVVSTEQKRNM
ncbi:MAG: hypothetical protein AB7O67_16595 [Vicinamibacterales bacterium]